MYNRILLKLSGESLMGAKQYGIDENRLAEYAQQIKEVADMGIQVGIVIGGGNIFRGLSGAGKGFDRVKGDQMGMLATTINALGLSSALNAIGQKEALERCDGIGHTAIDANAEQLDPFVLDKPSQQAQRNRIVAVRPPIRTQNKRSHSAPPFVVVGFSIA